MKKLILAISVVAMFASCEKEANVVATGSVVLTPMIEGVSANSLNKKGTVNRGGIPVYVSSIDATISGGDADVNETFNLVDDNSGTSAFIFNAVPLNSNAIHATSVPTNQNEYNIFQKLDIAIDALPSNNDNGTDVPAIFGLTGADALPYVTYSGDATISLAAGDVNDISVDMKPEQGRAMGVFTNNSDYIVKVSWAVFMDVTTFADLSDSSYRTIELAPGEVAGFYITGAEWGEIAEAYNDINLCKSGAHLKVSWLDANGNEVLHYEKTSNPYFWIPAIGESEYAVLNLTNDNITKESTTATFQFEPINEATYNYNVNGWAQ